MKRAGALRAWGLAVIWVAGSEQPAQLTATPETPGPLPVTNHYHLHLAPGDDAAAIIREATQSGTVVPEIRE